MDKKLLVEKFQKSSLPCITIKNLFSLKDNEADQLLTVLQSVLDVADRKNFPSPLILGVEDLAKPEQDDMPIQCLQSPTGVHLLIVKELDGEAICKHCKETFFVEK